MHRVARFLRRLAPPALGACALVACSSGGRIAGATSGSGAPLEEADGGACVVPPAAHTFDDASDHGCRPNPISINGAAACSPSEYGLTCVSGAMDASLPEPADALRCKVLPLPTPEGVMFYCCPCGS